MSASRIVSFTPSTTDILRLLGLEDRIIAADSLSMTRLSALQAVDLGPIDAINVSRLDTLDPDLVIASSSVAGAEAALTFLEEAPYPVVLLHTERFDDLFADIYTIGVECGIEEKARKVVENLTQRARRIAAGVSGSGEPLRAYFEWYPNPFVSAGSQSWVSDLLKKAGALNIFQDTYHPSFVLDDEAEIIARDPEAIFICWRGLGDEQDLDPDLILGRKGWEAVAAIKRRQVHVLPESLFAFPGPQLLDALELLVDLVARSLAER